MVSFSHVVAQVVQLRTVIIDRVQNMRLALVERTDSLWRRRSSIAQRSLAE